MQLLDTGDVVIDRYFDKAKNVWLLDGMDDAISETVGLCFIAEARKECPDKKIHQQRNPRKIKRMKERKRTDNFV